MSYDLTYFGAILEPLRKLDARHMSAEFRELFNKEADSDGFTRGSKSFVVDGPTALDDCRAAYASFNRGQYSVAYIDPRTIIRRLDSKWIPRWTPADDLTLEDAEILILVNLFDDEATIDTLEPSQKADLVWFLKEAITTGVVLIIPITNKNADLDLLGEEFGTFIEKNFEVVNVTQPNDKQQHNGNETTSKRNTKRKR